MSSLARNRRCSTLKGGGPGLQQPGAGGARPPGAPRLVAQTDTLPLNPRCCFAGDQAARFRKGPRFCAAGAMLVGGRARGEANRQERQGQSQFDSKQEVALQGNRVCRQNTLLFLVHGSHVWRICRTWRIFLAFLAVETNACVFTNCNRAPVKPSLSRELDAAAQAVYDGPVRRILPP